MRDCPDPPRLDALIRWAAAEFQDSPTPMIDARALAKSAFGLDEAGLIIAGGHVAAVAPLGRFVSMVARRANAEPVAHILGVREFWSLELEIEPGILVPRTDSEAVIEAIVSRRPAHAPLRILDLGCGSGALLCALMNEFPHAEGLGVDKDPNASALTARNLSRLGFANRARAEQGCWFGPVVGSFDVIVSNPPYIRSIDRDKLPREVRDFESPLALFAGEDGLDAYRKIAAGAPRHLVLEGLMVLEFGEGQGGSVNQIIREALPHAKFAVEPDLAGRPRVLVVDLGRSPV